VIFVVRPCSAVSASSALIVMDGRPEGLRYVRWRIGLDRRGETVLCGLCVDRYGRQA
jgi:hypothetical protein